MRQCLLAVTIALLAAIAESGCTPAAPRPVAVPPGRPVAICGPVREHEPMKPLPPERRQSQIPPPYSDVPLVSQTPPEEPAFLDAYQRVGRPRLMILVVNPKGSATSNAALGVDDQALQAVLGDWLSCNGAVNLISPQISAAGPPSTRGAQPIDADVLVRVEVHPELEVRQVRLIAEAVNTRGGESIGRAVVDVPAPLAKDRLNESTRFIARKLMDEMTQSWNQMLAERPQSGEPSAEPQSRQNASPAPATAPSTIP